MEERMMLVYEHKTNGRKLVPSGVSIMDELDLATILSAFPDVSMVTKTIKPGCTSVDIYKADLEGGEQQRSEKGGEVKEEEVPYKTFLGYEFAGHSFDELVILFPSSLVEKNVDVEAEAVGKEVVVKKKAPAVKA